MKRSIIFFAFLLICHTNLFCQELERRPLMGIAYDTNPTIVNSELPRGVDIKFIVPNSSAQKAGLQVGDIIVEYQGTQIQSKLDFKNQMRNQRTGDKVSIKYIRNGELINQEMSLTPFPKEEHPGFEIQYGQVSHNGNRIRSYITKPSTVQKKFPAVYIIQGIGCGPIENPFKQPSGISSLVDSLTLNGFVTFRMDRSGAGDSQGTPCQEIGFKEDLANFKAGLKKLKTYDFVDDSQIFLIGISMGGIMAPLISQEESVAGMIVYGTGGKDWYSYELENTFRQALLEGIPMEELNTYMNREKQRLHYFFTEKKTPAEIKKIDQKMGENCEAYPLHYSYFQDVADLDMYSIWSECDAKVLAIHGHSDFVSSDREHEFIAYMVNQRHPGNGTYYEFPEADHWMNKTENEKASFDKKFEGINLGLISYMNEWLLNR